MKYPEFLKQGDTIGVTAPSDGNHKPMDVIRLELAEEKLAGMGYSVWETENVRQSDKRGRSSSKEERAYQLMQLITNPDVTYIISAKGGDFLMEILPLLDFGKIKEHPTWFQGYSDNTGLTYTIATNCDIATVYGNHFNDFAMEPWHKSVQDNYNLMCGKQPVQCTFDFYEDDFYDRERPEEGYRKDKPCSQIAVLDGREIDEVSMEGRLLGGCIDVLLNLVGTTFDHTTEFIQRYEQDGILWYLESFSLDSDSLTRGLWQLKNAGWFDTAKGFVFGRPCMFQSFTDHSYREAVEVILSELHVPIVYEADIGHKAPQFSIVNGAVGCWKYQSGKSELSMVFR